MIPNRPVVSEWYRDEDGNIHFITPTPLKNAGFCNHCIEAGPTLLVQVKMKKRQTHDLMNLCASCTYTYQTTRELPQLQLRKRGYASGVYLPSMSEQESGARTRWKEHVFERTFWDPRWRDHPKSRAKKKR